MELNTVYNMPFEQNRLPDHCADLIIADPPYYRVAGDFDFVWNSFESYLDDVEKWGRECRRLLKDNGTLIWYGSDQRIAYSQVILDKLFSIVNNCTWAKTNGSAAYFSISAARSFFPNSERFLIYESLSEVREVEGREVKDRFMFEQGMCKTRVMRPLIDYLRAEMKRAGYTPGMVNKALRTCMAAHWFTEGSQWELPTEAWYGKLRELFNSGEGKGFLDREYEELRREYESLRREYEELRRPFNLPERMTDVIRMAQDSSLSSKWGHPTVKSEKLTSLLITITTRPDALVVIPFAGSGTECAMAARLGRRYVGFEIDGTWADVADKRAKEERKPNLF